MSDTDQVVSMYEREAIEWICAILAFCGTFFIGANDLGNSMATIYGSRALSLKQVVGNCKTGILRSDIWSNWSTYSWDSSLNSSWWVDYQSFCYRPNGVRLIRSSHAFRFSSHPCNPMCCFSLRNSYFEHSAYYWLLFRSHHSNTRFQIAIR